MAAQLHFWKYVLVSIPEVSMQSFLSFALKHGITIGQVVRYSDKTPILSGVFYEVHFTAMGDPSHAFGMGCEWATYARRSGKRQTDSPTETKAREMYDEYKKLPILQDYTPPSYAF